MAAGVGGVGHNLRFFVLRGADGACFNAGVDEGVSELAGLHFAKIALPKPMVQAAAPVRGVRRPQNAFAVIRDHQINLVSCLGHRLIPNDGPRRGRLLFSYPNCLLDKGSYASANRYLFVSLVFLLPESIPVGFCGL